ncbi:ABC transporter permease [Paenibacillus turpanensis]|uniref:ABC transporter permease n=1 Tax=Paenibacillus turpanensis TaxID=2689078 RepID=UPI00140DC81A|nr:ABC transporter permease [Paenibacillus turpanensis]
MFVISRREFFGLFKGVKSIILIAILFLTSYYSAKFAHFLLSELELTGKDAENVHATGLLALILFLGQLFVMALSHDCVNRETHDRTIRFLVTRTSRFSILGGKFVGVWLFWLASITISFLLVSIYSRKLDFFIYSQTLSTVTYYIALTVLLSVLIPKPSITMFIGVVIGLSLPGFGFWLNYTSNMWLSWIKYVMPYYYLMRDDYSFLVIIVLAGLMLGAAQLVFHRRDF